MNATRVCCSLSYAAEWCLNRESLDRRQGRAKGCRWHGLGEEVALSLLHTQLPKRRQILCRFDTLSHQLCPGPVAKLDEGCCQRCPSSVPTQVAGDADVQLDVVGPQVQHVPETGVASSGIVNGYSHPSVPQWDKRAEESCIVLYGLVLRDFDDDALGLDAVERVRQNTSPDQGAGRHIDANRQI